MGFLAVDKLATKQCKEHFLAIKSSLITEAIAFPIGQENNRIKTVVKDWGNIESAAKTQSGGVINVKLITTVIQKFTRSRGLCVLSDKELQQALEPYLRGRRK